MDALEQLHFEVILDHDKFTNEIKAVTKNAEDFAQALQSSLDLTKKISKQDLDMAKNAEKVRQEVEKTALAEQKVATEKAKTATQEQKLATEAEKTAAAHQRTIKAVQQTNTQLRTTQSLVSTIAQLTGVYLGVAGVRRFVSSLVEVTGQFEVQKMALTSMLQSADKADEVFTRLRQNALESPYTFADLTKFAKQLTAFNIPYEKLVDTEKMLADVAAAVGVDMSRIILAYGQVKAAGALKGQELRQFTESGVPILEELAKQIEETEGKAVSLSEVFSRISKKQIPFEMVEEAFRRMTSEGGKFYNMQEVLVQTLQGRIGKLRDVWQQALYDLGTANDGVLKGTVDLLTALAGHLTEIVNVLAPVIAAFGAYYGALMLAAAAEKAVAGALVIGNIARLATNAADASKKLAALGVSAKAAAVGLVAFAAVAGFEIYQALNKSNKELQEFEQHLDDIHDEELRNAGLNEAEYLKSLKERAEDVNKTYDERMFVINKLMQTVPEYHAQLDAEGNLIERNAEALDTYIEKLQASAKAKAIDKELTRLHQERLQVEAEVTEAQNNVNNAPVFGLSPNGNLLMGFVNGLFDKGQANRNLDTAEAKLAKIDERIKALAQSANDPAVAAALGWGDDWNGNSIFGTPKSDAEKSAENRIALLRKFKDALDKLSPYLGDEGAMNALKMIFDPDGSNGYNFSNLTEQLTDAINALAALGGDNVQKAEQLLATLGLDEVSKMTAALKQYETAKAKFEKDWGLQGSGVAFDASKIASDYVNEQQKIDNEYADAQKKLAEAHGYTAEQIEEEEAALKSLYDARSRANKATTDDKIANLVSAFVKENTGNLKMSDWADKSIGQVREIYDTLTHLASGEMIFSVEMVEALQTAGFSLQTFADLCKDAFGDMAEEAEEELQKKMGDAIKEMTSLIDGATDSMIGFAEAVGNTKFAEEAKLAGEIVNTVADVADKWMTGNKEGAVIAGLSFIVSKIFEAATATARFNNELTALSEQSHRNALSELLVASGVFGTNAMAQLRGARGVMAYTLADMQNKARMTNLTLPGTYGVPESALGMMARLGIAQYDSNGILNRDSLQFLIDTYPEMSQWLTILKNDVDAYYEALESVNSVMQEIVGNVVSDAADAMIDQWIAAGDAALDYADILDSVARSYAKMVVQSMLMEAMPENLVEQLAQFAMNGQNEDFMATLESAMEGLQAMTPYVNQVLESMAPYIKSDSTSENSTGAGIKAITEETASLLASYINAMRADLSFMRGLQERGWGQVDLIAQAVPTLNDYLQQIAANTYDAAADTNRILSELRSVIGAEGTSGQIVRVQIA